LPISSAVRLWAFTRRRNAPVFFGPTPGDSRPIGRSPLAANIGFLRRTDHSAPPTSKRCSANRASICQRTEIETRRVSLTNATRSARRSSRGGLSESELTIDSPPDPTRSLDSGPWRSGATGMSLMASCTRSSMTPNHIWQPIFDRPRCPVQRVSHSCSWIFASVGTDPQTPRHGLARGR